MPWLLHRWMSANQQMRLVIGRGASDAPRTEPPLVKCIFDKNLAYLRCDGPVAYFAKQLTSANLLDGLTGHSEIDCTCDSDFGTPTPRQRFDGRPRGIENESAIFGFDSCIRICSECEK